MGADMSITDADEPAFPYPDHGRRGMTLRDYFAAKAMQRLMDIAMPMSELAAGAYDMADAMLEARNGVAVGRKIEELGLSLKTENCLKADDICTVEQLTKLTSNHLLKIPNMGRKSVLEIEQALFVQGLRLRDGQP